MNSAVVMASSMSPGVILPRPEAEGIAAFLTPLLPPNVVDEKQVAMYRVFDHQDNLLYVGTTKKGAATRIAEHQMGVYGTAPKSWGKEIDHYDECWYANRSTALTHEAHNVVHQPPRYQSNNRSLLHQYRMLDLAYHQITNVALLTFERLNPSYADKCMPWGDFDGELSQAVLNFSPEQWTEMIETTQSSVEGLVAWVGMCPHQAYLKIGDNPAFQVTVPKDFCLVCRGSGICVPGGLSD